MYTVIREARLAGKYQVLIFESALRVSRRRSCDATERWISSGSLVVENGIALSAKLNRAAITNFGWHINR